MAPMEELAIKQGMEVTFPGQESYKDLKNISDPCVIILADKLEIVKVDDIRSNHSKISGKNVFFVSPGQHSFDILRDTGISIGSSSGSGSGGLSVSVSHSDRLKAPYNNIKYTFEKGKSYNLTMSVEKDVPIFSEIIIESELASIEKYKNDLYAFIKNLKFDDTKNIKMYESYLNYSKINHHLLDGKWKYVPVLFHASEDIMIISGNNIDYIFPENPIFPTFAPWKGKIIYNENTIIILWDIKPTVTNPSTTRQVAWYYTVNGDILETKARYGGIAFPDLGGQFKRIKD
ncbi:MAG: hypothetical protein LBT38_02840 [Deltaproteobacteria bacterium]|nr:hypothetical protein [Deltaproteobacteria bacterium]